jgi:hypothetical protein
MICPAVGSFSDGTLVSAGREKCLQRWSSRMCCSRAKQDTEFAHPHAVRAQVAQQGSGITRNSAVASDPGGLCPVRDIRTKNQVRLHASG